MSSEQLSLDSLKRGMLKLLKEDEEFRYAVAAYLGYHEILEKLKLHDKKFEEVLRRLGVLEQDVATLKEDVATLKEDVSSLKQDQRSMRAMLERLSLSLEEEAREVVRYLLRERGIEVSPSTLALPEVEFDVFATSDDTLIIGEATVRLGLKQLVKIDDRMEKFLMTRREYSRKNVVKVVYTMWTTKEVREEAERRKIWLIRSGIEETPFPL